MIGLVYDSQYQFLAIETLGKMGPIAIPALTALVKGKDEHRWGLRLKRWGRSGREPKPRSRSWPICSPATTRSCGGPPATRLWRK